MKKNLILSIITILLTASTVFGASTNTKTRDCIIFEIEGTVLQGTEVKDEKGSVYVHHDFVPFKSIRILFIDGKNIWIASVKKSGKQYSINGTGTNKQSFRVINPTEGSLKGYMTTSFSIGGKGVGIPSATCTFSGETINEFNEETGKYEFKSGSGTFTGSSYPSSQSLNYTAPALIATEKMAPAWGTFKAYRIILTDDELIELLK